MSSISGGTPHFTPHHGGGGPGGAFTTSTATGKFDKEIQLGGGEPHERFVYDVGGDKWEADINVHSIKGPDGSSNGSGSDVQYAIQDKVVSSMPAIGVQNDTHVSYDALNLKDSDFQPVGDDAFQKQLEGMAEKSSEISITGQTYTDGLGKHGIHDIHMNSDEVNSSNHPNEDGVVKFYTNEGGQIHEQTVFIKFQSQHLQAKGEAPASNSLLNNQDQGMIAGQ